MVIPKTHALPFWAATLMLGCSSETTDGRGGAADLGAAAVDAGFFDMGVGEAPDAGFGADAGFEDSGVASLCPPEGPFGIRAGQQLPPLELRDCDGNTHNLHELCDAKASYTFVFAGW